jgi:hypothetical protein
MIIIGFSVVKGKHLIVTVSNVTGRVLFLARFIDSLSLATNCSVYETKKWIPSVYQYPCIAAKTRNSVSLLRTDTQVTPIRQQGNFNTTLDGLVDQINPYMRWGLISCRAQ